MSAIIGKLTITSIHSDPIEYEVHQSGKGKTLRTTLVKVGRFSSKFEVEWPITAKGLRLHSSQGFDLIMVNDSV